MMQDAATTTNTTPEASLNDCISQKDWETTSKLIKETPSLVEDISRSEFAILWENAPLDIVRAVLKARPDSYKEGWYDEDLVTKRMEMEQFDFLETIAKEFSQVALKYYTRKHNWEEIMKLIKEQPDLAKKELSRDEFKIIWKDAPLDVIRVLLKAWPEAYQTQSDSWGYTNLPETKMQNKEWEVLSTIFEEFPHVLESKDVEEVIASGAPLEFLKKHWKDIPMLSYSIRNKDWGQTTEILKKQPELSQRQIAGGEFEILWEDAPSEVILLLLSIWPDACKETGYRKKNLVEMKMIQKQWEFLDTIFKEYPQATALADVQAVIQSGAPLELLNKYWDDIPMLSYFIQNKDWDETTKILKNLANLPEQELARQDIPILWGDAPVEVISLLLKDEPELYKAGSYGSNLMQTKTQCKEWDFLGAIFEEFPKVLEETDLKYAIRYDAPLEFLNKYWKETGTLLHFIQGKNWERIQEILASHPHLAEKDISGYDFDIIWKDAPMEVIRALLVAWPEGFKGKNEYSSDLPHTKMKQRKWDFLGILFQEFPQVRAGTDVKDAVTYKAPLEFLETHWDEIPMLSNHIHEKNWDKTMEIFRNQPQVANKELSKKEFEILWDDAPTEVIRALLEAWPEAHKEEGDYGGPLAQKKMLSRQWDSLKTVIQEFPFVLSEEDVIYAWRFNSPPLDVHELMIDQHPNVPLKNPRVVFDPIRWGKIDFFRVVLEHCPAALDIRDEEFRLTPLLEVFQNPSTVSVDWIDLMLKVNTDAAREKDFDGKTPLHLAYQLGASAEIIDMILQAYPEAENARDNLGRTPKQLANQSENLTFTPLDKALVLSDHDSEKERPNNAVVVCRGHTLMRDLPGHGHYAKQVLARHTTFETLLHEFSNMVGIDDKDVIQKAATMQAVASKYLSQQDKTVIDFRLYGNPGYWYQQEVLKLVMRVYHEAQSYVGEYSSSILQDAQVCLSHLESRKNGENPPGPSGHHAHAFSELLEWLTEGLGDNLYSLQGPVLKPLQSLFNKLFIRRGQTNVHIIGDMTRATLLVDDKETLQQIVSKIKTTFPNIAENQFKHPDTFNGLSEFLTYVHDDLNYIPNSTDVLPYRFKMNSSQKKKEEPLWFNFNFFCQIPEYHRVGESEMFVACEMQIGLTEEVNAHRKDHVAYERERILSNQPLLKNYDVAMKAQQKEDSAALTTENKTAGRSLGNCSTEDNKLIESVLFGRIAENVLIPSGENENVVLFKSGSFTLSLDQVWKGSYAKPDGLCINNRSVNWHTTAEAIKVCQCAFVAARPYTLDSTKRYYVDSFIVEGIYGLRGTVGLYARVGSYLIELACKDVDYKYDRYAEDGNNGPIVGASRNYTFLEQICPVPVGSTALEVIAHGQMDPYKDFQYRIIKLTLKQFEVQK